MTTSQPSAPRESNYRADFFAFRTPLLPFAELTRLTEGLETSAALSADSDRLDAGRKHLATAVQRDRERIRARMREMLQRPVIREAIYVASPDLAAAIDDWEKAPEHPDSLQVEESLYRYLSRMCYRCTPFGMFAGCSLGTIGDENRLQVEAEATYRSSTRLDMGYLEHLSQALAADPAVREVSIYRPNTSLYRAAGRLRYAESRSDENGRSYHLVAVRPTPFLDRVIARAEAGATVQELVGALVEMDVDFDEARAFVFELVDSQILQTTLAPSITGAEPIHGMIAACDRNPATKAVADTMASVRDRLAALDAGGLTGKMEGFPATANELRRLPAKVEIGRLFQVDMFKPARATLRQSVIDDVLQSVAILHMTSASARNDAFQGFVNAFVGRYETREVPLVEVLDEESGIGFFKSSAPGSEPSPLLDDIQFATVQESAFPWGSKERVLLHLLLDAREKGAQSIDIAGPVLGALAQQPGRPMPRSFAVMAAVVADSVQDFEQGKYRLHVSGCSGPSGANLLGRFCHGDPQLTEKVRQHLAVEEALDPDCVFAEVVHLPEGRIGNVLLRPHLRRYEIPFCGQSGVDAEHLIPITDLTVAVVDRRVVLRSRTLNKRVLPRLSTAHGYFTDRNLGIYRFLCMLQGQGLAGGMAWNWGPFEGASFLPRVTCGHLVLSRARWILTAGELRAAVEAEGADRMWKFHKLREQRKLPRSLVLADSDNELLVDLENPLSVDSFCKVIKARGAVLLKEVFAEAEGLVATGPEGAFTHELLIPFVQKLPQAVAGETVAGGDAADRPTAPAGAAAPATALPAGAPAIAIQRSFLPGSEWLYAKFYAGTATCDEVLREVVEPIAKEAMERGHADSWFFLRYGDPDWHVRVRFHGDPTRLVQHVLPQLGAAAARMRDDGRVWRFQLDTYEREVERYGGDEVMPIAERMFCADSMAVLEMLAPFHGDALADARWRLALVGADRLCNDLGFDLRDRHALMARLSDGFAAEFHFKDTALQHQTGKKFRAERKDLEQLLDPARCDAHPLAAGLVALAQRSERMAAAVQQLHAVRAAGRMGVTLQSFAGSLIHMHTNRVLRAAARAQELLIYDFLHRLYESRLARQRSRDRAAPR